MTTGLTYSVIEGKTKTFQDFVWDCARQFGALIHLRDSPMKGGKPPLPPDETPRFDKDLADARAQLEAFLALSNEEIEARAQSSYEESLASYKILVEERKLRMKRLEAMRARVWYWDPPTPEHDSLKQFMLTQLNSSIEREEPSSPPERQSAEEYASMMVECLASRIKYLVQARERARSSRERAIQWIEALHESLQDEEPGWLPEEETSR